MFKVHVLKTLEMRIYNHLEALHLKVVPVRASTDANALPRLQPDHLLSGIRVFEDVDLGEAM